MKGSQKSIVTSGKGPRRFHPQAIRFLSCLLCLLVWSASVRAAITIEGVTDKKVYADRVSFTIHSEAGFDYTAELTSATAVIPVAIDVQIEVNEPEYYELSVQRQEEATGAVESQLIRFIVRATARANSEWGLPAWTPYPPIDSAAAEFVGAQLLVVTPAEYPLGLEIPVVARVEDVSGSRVGVNGSIILAGFEKYPLRLLRGVGSVFLPAVAEPGVIPCTAEIHSLSVSKKIVVEEATNWKTVSEDISGSVDWGDNARIRVMGAADGKLTIGPGATLTIGSGSVVVLDPDVDIAVEGHLVVNGTMERPVVFTSQNRTKPWGGFIFEKSTSRGEFAATILTGGGADPDWFGNNPGHGHSHRSEQPLLFVSNGARLTLTDCYIVENSTGQAGHGEGGYLTMQRCLVQKCISAGQYNGGAVTLEDSALIEFPSATAPFADDDNDALYLTGGAHLLTNCLVGWALDDGIDGGSGSNGSVTVRRCWLESTYHEGLAWSEQGPRTSIDTVTINCGQGIECGFGSPDVNAVHCLSTANWVGARFGDNYDWSYNGFLEVRDSLLLFNARDIWGRAWDNWDVHLSQMDIRASYVSIPYPEFPDNQLWDPLVDPNQAAELVPFLPTPADTVGVGFATWEDTLDVAALSKGIPIRLSTFTPNPVSVDYEIAAGTKLLDSGTLYFVPGETVKHVRLDGSNIASLCQVRVTLSNPVNAEVTGYGQVTCRGTCGVVQPLIREGDEWRYFKGTEEPPADWNALMFDDSTWLAGPTPIGYEASTGYEARLATTLNDMRNKYLSVYARRLFTIADPSQLTRLTLTVDVDDGYVAYLNGIQVATLGVPTGAKFDQTASNREACCGSGTPTGPCPPAAIDLSDHIKDLVAGTNVLALQVHNQSLSSSDLIFIPELSALIAPDANEP
jgi:hypothetical protein